MPHKEPKVERYSAQLTGNQVPARIDFTAASTYGSCIMIVSMKTAFSREGLYYLFVVFVVMLGAVLREVNPLLLFSVFLCVPLWIAWRLGRRALRGISVKRKLPLQIYAGEPFIVNLEVDNVMTSPQRPISCWGLVVVDRIFPLGDAKAKPYEPAVYFEFVPKGEGRRKTYAGRLPQRGRYGVGPLNVSTRFPFGFFRNWFDSTTAESGKSEICVFPKLGKLATNWQTRQHESAESLRRHRFRPSRVSGEFLGVRRWQSGDARKWIHWRASAKHGEPVVRQFEQYQNRDCAVLLDLFQPSKPTAIERENFELAVSFTATLVSEITRRGGCSLFFATNKENFLTGPVCLPLVENILERLAIVERRLDDDFPELLLETLQNTDPSADLVLVSPQPLDLARSPRFDAVRNDPRFRALFQRLRCVDTSGPELEGFFTF